MLVEYLNFFVNTETKHLFNKEAFFFLAFVKVGWKVKVEGGQEGVGQDEAGQLDRG